MAAEIRVLTTYCPFWERTVYELWDGTYPIIAANNYLRSDLTLEDSTLADKAFSLLHFFRFLKRNSLDFFALTQESLTPFILLFRNELLWQVRSADADNSKSRTPSQKRLARVLTEVGFLCDWWGLIKPLVYRPNIGNRFSRLKSRSLPACFRIASRKDRKKFKDNHVLEPNEIEAIWQFVTAELRPIQPDLLRSSPSGPRRGWSSSRAAAWKREKDAYLERVAWFHRQQMLWALMLSSGMRRSEVPLIKINDVEFHREDLWVCLRPRQDTATLGRAKTGTRTIFIGWDSRVIVAWQNWMRSREILLNKWVQSGNARHEMFLTNRNGGPLTVEGLSSLFDKLDRRFEIFGGKFLEDQFRIHPHAVRHSVNSLFEERGVARHIRQRHLGHKRPETTDLYGKVYRKTYRDVLARLEASITKRVNEKTA
jgi:integrase